jgi:hypothetical protein
MKSLPRTKFHHIERQVNQIGYLLDVPAIGTFTSIYTSIDHFNHTRGASLKQFHRGRDSVLG